MALVRYKHSLGFVVPTDTLDSYLLTVFIPDTDPAPSHEYASIADAIHAGGVFAQFDVRMPQVHQDPDSVFQQTRAWANAWSGKVAFAVMTSPSDGLYVVSHDGNWNQSADTDGWFIRHLGKLNLAPLSNGKIQQHARNPDMLQLGDFALYRGDFLVRCNPAVDLLSGKFVFEFDADSTFFTALNVSQPFQVGVRVRDLFGDKTLVSASRTVSVFNTNAMTNVSHPLRAELDLFPHVREIGGAKLTEAYLERTAFYTLASKTRSASRVLLTARDTLGRQLETELGYPGQRFCLFPSPAAAHHQPDRPDEFIVDVPDTTLIPQGVFPIQSAFPSGVAARRMKFGPSNTEVLEIRETGGRPNMALEFTALPDSAQRSGSIATGGFLRQSMAALATQAGASSQTILDLREGPALTSLFDSVWPAFRAMDANGAVIDFTEGTRSGNGAIYSVQPDKIVRFAVKGQSPDATDDSLGYQREDVGLVSGPMPFTFLDGVPDRPMGPQSRPSDLELALAGHRFELRLNAARTNRRFSGRSADVPSPDPTRTAGDVANITPQGFEVVVKPESRCFVLAKTERGGVTLDLTIDVKNRDLNMLFQQNSYLLVLPTDRVVLPDGGTQDDAIALRAKIQMGSWAFDLGFSKEGIVTGNDDAPNNRSILILKYRKGRLSDVLRDENTWDNFRSGLLASDWVRGAKSAMAEWLDGIQKNENDRAYRLIQSVVNDESWTGVLMINPTVDLDHLPEALQSLVAGIDLERFRGHHIGFTQNKIEIGGNGPRIEKSALFGLIDYKDHSGFGHPKTSDGKTAAPNEKFDFRVNTLQVLFSNSEVQDFNCLLRIYVPSWFKDNVTEVKGGPTPSHKPPREKGDRKNVFAIRGRHQAFLDANGQKVTRYSFVSDGEINLVQEEDDTFIFEKVDIDRVELRTTKSHSLSDGKREIRSELLFDAVVGFRDNLGGVGLDDILSFESLELSGVAVPFNVKVEKTADNSWRASDWDFELPKLTFEGLSLGTDQTRRRPNSLLKSFPIKFKTFRFFETPKDISSFKFLQLFSNAGGTFEYGLEWDVDFGTLAKMLGFDSGLKGTMIVGWLPRGERDTFGKATVGLRFDDMGGDRLDIGVGSVLRLKAGYFDIFNPKDDDKGKIIVASDMSFVVFGEEVPKDPDKLGLILAPNPEDPLNGPLGWLTMLKIDELGFVEKFKLGLGQNMKYEGQGPDTPREIIKEVATLTHFSMAHDLPAEDKLDRSKEFREKFETILKYNQGNEWFVALGGEVAKVGSAHAVYNPPDLFGGEVRIEGLGNVSILYRQETPQIGMYTGTLTVSEKIRSIDVGAVRIQLPRLVVKTDTDGGYSFNVGLNVAKPDDFSNAAGAEVKMFKGDAGLLYANIHGSAFKDVPKLKTGEAIYSPITRIMLAGRFGLGRTFKKSILSAGASITMYGILSGTWGNRNLKNVTPTTATELLDDGLPNHYNKYWGEVGIIAEIFGVVDFGITRQRLDARLLVGIGIVFETWKETLAYIRGELRVSLEWVVARFKVFGKTIELKITLRFATEYRQDYVLNSGRSDLYEKWFSSPTRALARKEMPFHEAGPIVLDFDWSRKPDRPQDNKKKRMPLLVTLDLTVDDARKPIIVPMTFIPFSTTMDSDNTVDPGPFKDLVTLVFEWSLKAAYAQLPTDTTVIPFDVLLEIEKEIARRDWAADRGSWASHKAWAVLTEQFEFELLNEGQGNIAGGTIFTLPGGFSGEARFPQGTQPQQIQLGGTTVDSAYLRLLDTFFDKIRVKVDQERNEDEAPTYRATKIGRNLDEFLFEEFLESILRAVWGRIADAILRVEPEWSNAPRLDQLRAFVAKEATAVSGMLNRQVFSGMRLPKSNTPRATKTVALWEKANRAIDVSEWLGKDIQALSLTATYPGLNKSVDFEVDDASPIDSLPGIEPVFGSVTVEQVVPFHEADGDRYPLPERVPLSIGGTDKETLWSIPEALADKAMELERDAGQGPLTIALEKAFEGEVGKDQKRKTVSYDPVTLISLPVLPMAEASDSFVIQQIKEVDRRLLDEFDRAKIPSKDVEIAFYAQEHGENGRVERMDDPGIDLTKSFIGRVNLSSDPNAPVIGLQRAVSSGGGVMRARPIAAESEDFFWLLRSAAETNSGGYLLHIEGWTQQETQRVWIALRLKGSKYEGHLPVFINRFVTNEVVGPNSLGHVVRKKDPQVIPNGEPGVFVAKVTRQNPDTLYRDPSGPADGPRSLSRVQVLNIIEQQRGLEAAMLVDMDRKGQLAAEVLEDAGGNEVELGKRFNLMQVDISQQTGFKALPGHCDLPTGPEEDRDSATGNMIYTWSIPAHEFVDHADNELFPSSGDPFVYGAIGRKMKIKVEFRDILGYTPHLQNAEELDLEGKYFDPLISLTGLTGLQVTHTIEKSDGDLKIAIAFNPRAVVNADNPTGPVRLPRDDDGEPDSREKERVRSIRAAYMRFMQQLRDANTKYHLESSLRFAGLPASSDLRKPLSDDDRKTLHGILKKCRDALDDLANNRPVTDLTFPELSFRQKGTPPKDGVVRYSVRFCAERDNGLIWPRVADMERTKVRMIAADIPLRPRSQAIGATPSETLAEAMMSAFSGKVRLAFSRDGQDDEALYVVNEALLDLRIAADRNVPAFAAITPLSTRPYAIAKTGIWDWAENKAPPSPGAPTEDWLKREISAFDQDTALHTFLRDIDIALSPEEANAVWQKPSDVGAQAFDALLVAKSDIATAAASRVTSILDVAKDHTAVVEAAKSLQTNLENSFKKRLGRVSDVDTVLVLPMEYPAVGEDKKFILYGRMSKDTPANKADDHHFLPAALHRDGTTNPLIIQFDAKEPAGRECYETDAEFAIEHVRWDRDTSETSFGVIWLKLFKAKKVPLVRNSGSAGILTVPILFKKLVTKPDVSLAPPELLEEVDPSWSLDKAIKEARKWTFKFDVERARAATQDDLFIDVNYNTRPDRVFAARFGSGDRAIGDVLFEYTLYRAALNTPENRDLWLQALAYWGGFVARGLAVADLQVSRSMDDLAEVTQSFILKEKKDAGNDTLILSLEKLGSWSASGFRYSVEAIAADRRNLSDEDRERSDVLGPLPRTIVIEKPRSPFETGEYYAGRRISSDGLDILNFENAWPAVKVKRNQSLAGFGTTAINPVFVYETEERRSGEALTPLLTIDSPINLPLGNGATKKQKLSDSLKQLFDAAFKGLDDADKRPLVDMAWGYDSGQLDKYLDVPEAYQDKGMRVFASDPIGMFTARKLKADYSDAIGIVWGSVSAWQTRNLRKAAPTSGRFVFQLRIYSRLERIEKPLLILSDLRYNF